MKILNRALLLALTGSLALTSCLKKDYDTPPDTSGIDPQLPVNMTIGKLKDLKLDADTALITEDWTIAAVVSADDRSGNLYKQLVVQDSTGGIAISIDAVSLYANYPVGRKVYIKLKGLVLGNSDGTPVIGGGASEAMTVTGIPGSMMRDVLVKATTGNYVKDTVLTLDQARTFSAATEASLINRLVTIEGVQWADTTKPYTEPNSSTSRFLLACGNNSYVGNSAPTGTIAVRTSNFAKFRGVMLPSGNGRVRGIYTVYRGSPQLLIRDTSDVMFNAPRCGGVAPPPTSSNARLIPIDSLRMMFSGSGIKLGSYKIAGTVTSDASSKNISTGAFIIQDGSGKGIQLYLGSSASYALGDSIVVDVTGDSLKRYNGAMEVEGVSTSAVQRISTGRTVNPVTLTIAQLNANFGAYEQVLVRILNATVTEAGTTYSGNKTLVDATGNIVLRTGTAATFSGATIPTGVKTFTVLAGYFNTTKQVLMRNANDVQ